MSGNVKFGIDNPVHNGTSYVFSPEGMSILADQILPAQSNIIIKIYRNFGKTISIEGKVVWSSSISDSLSIMGINFNCPNKELLEIYEARTSTPQ